MTADERIEVLLNRAGQTISDLPEADENSYAYDYDTNNIVYETVGEWEKAKYPLIASRQLVDYILHLADIIDRMEAALENTLLKLQESENKLRWKEIIEDYEKDGGDYGADS